MNGLLMTVNFSIRVGSGTGPVTVDPVRCAVSTICAADWSISLWSYALSRIRMRCFAICLRHDLCHDARADGVPALADRVPQSGLDGDGGAELDLGGDVVAGHDHLGALGQLHRAGHVGRPQVELRAVAGEERRVTATLLL